jgi:hypothetical protein
LVFLESAQFSWISPFSASLKHLALSLVIRPLGGDKGSCETSAPYVYDQHVQLLGLHHMWFGKKGKLSPRYVGPFLMTEAVGPIAYRVKLPSNLAGVRDVFHVSMLRKHVHDPLHVIHFEPLQVQADLKYEEKPVQILDQKVQQLRTKTIPLVKVLLQNHEVEKGVRTRDKKQIPVSISVSHFEVGMFNTFVIYDAVYIIK